jgi:hypothetical protein
MRELFTQQSVSFDGSYKRQGVAQVFDIEAYNGVPQQQYDVACMFPDRVHMQVEVIAGKRVATLQGYYITVPEGVGRGRKPKPIYTFGLVGKFDLDTLPNFETAAAKVLHQYLEYAYPQGVRAVRAKLAQWCDDTSEQGDDEALVMPRYVLRRGLGAAVSWHLDVNAHAVVAVR